VGKISICEVVSGLGVGGAEKSFLNRLPYSDTDSGTTVINTKQVLDALSLGGDIEVFCCKRIGLVLKIRELVRTRNFDVFITRTPMDSFFVAASLKLLRVRAFHVFEAHSVKISFSNYKSFIANFLHRWTLRHVDLVIAISQSVALGEQAVHASRIRVHYLGARKPSPSLCLSPMADKEISNSPDVFAIRFLFVGRFAPEKRVIEMLKGLSSISDDFRSFGGEFRFIGSGPTFKEAQDLVHELDLGDIFKLHGYQDNPHEFMETSDVLVSYSKYEGLPLTFYEAKLMGMRILTTPAGGCAEILDEHDILMHSFDIQEFIEKILSLLRAESKSRMNRATIADKSRRFDSSITSPAYYQIIRELVSNSTYPKI